MSISKHTQSIQIELPADDPTWLIDIDASFNWIGENYGADADGNRGMWVEYPENDGYEITKIQKYDENLDPHPAEGTPELLKMIEDYMEKWEPEPEEDHDDEEPPDRDR